MSALLIEEGFGAEQSSIRSCNLYRMNTRFEITGFIFDLQIPSVSVEQRKSSNILD